jgi:DNA-binding transcriptional ArsR family regulator
MIVYRSRARLLKVMAHPMRLQILEIVRASDECVCHLSAALKKSQPYISQQLAILRNAGLVSDRKEGNLVFYGMADGPDAAQAAEILGAIATGAEVGPMVDSPDANPEAGHRHVAGCTCPKCDPGGACTETSTRLSESSLEAVGFATASDRPTPLVQTE